MSALLERLQKQCSIKEAAVLSESILYDEKDVTVTPVPMINVALSGDCGGGLTSGLTVLAGPSKHFKTCFALLMASAYLRKNKDAVLMFYDNEFGSPQAYFESFGIDITRVLHIPIKSIEELKFDIVSQFEQMKRSDDVIVVIDSVGNLASKKELDDAFAMKSVADMTRAKALKGLFRMITPYLTMNNIPMIAVNHTYQEIGLFPKAIVSGGTGIYYSADTIWIIGRRQEKVGTEIKGYHFIINVEKSRFVKEKSKIPITVSWDGGIEKFSGLLDVALETGHVVKPKNGWYHSVDPVTKEATSKNIRAKETMSEEFWNPIFAKTDFAEVIKERFTVGTRAMIDDLDDVDTDQTEVSEVSEVPVEVEVDSEYATEDEA